MAKPNQYGINNSSYKDGSNVRVNTICSHCNSKTTKLKKSKKGFCDRNCFSLWQKTHTTGSSNSNYGKKHPHLNIGRKYSDETKLKLRNAQIKNVEKQVFNGLPMMPCVGKHETRILDFLEKSFNYTILRQHKVIGYFLDGYCPALNLAIEIDESHHKEQLENDKYREQQVTKELNCSFLRIETGD